MNNIMNSLKGIAWLAALGALSCNLQPSGQIETHGRGSHPRTGSGTDVVEQWVTATSVAKEMSEGTMGRVQTVAGAFQSAKLQFVNCDVPPCVTRVQAGTLADARALLQSLSDTYQGRVSYTAREVLDPYTGQSFQLDVVLDTGATRPLPQSDEELVTSDN